MRENKELWNKLMLLKDLTESTGVVHDGQVLQLQIYAHCLFGSTEIKIEQDPCTITFNGNPTTEVPLEVLEGLDRSVKSIMGEYFAVVVITNGTVQLNSPGTRAKHRRQRA